MIHETSIESKLPSPVTAAIDVGRERLGVAIVGGNLRAASILRLLSEVENIDVLAVSCGNTLAPAMRLAEDLGVYTTRDFTELYQLPSLGLIIDISDDPEIHNALQSQSPSSIELIGVTGTNLIWDLLVAKKRGEEQEKLFVELQIAYDKIRSHERSLQINQEKLERTNEELEWRLAEIFFTHEFFKALTLFSGIDDVCSLIVDGANGILGAEISCVYLLSKDDWTLRLVACQGRTEDHFNPVVSTRETILGKAFREGSAYEYGVPYNSESAGWLVEPGSIRSQAAVSLCVGDQVLGVLVIGSSVHREMSVAETERLRVISRQSSISVHNALLHDELERLSVTDRLTELYNHGHFQQRLEEEFRRAERFGHTLALIMLDIDNFKIFNDTYGHPRGDKVLQTVSAAIRSNLREIDVAARYGGEEFVVLLPETDADGALAVAERIRKDVEATQFIVGENIPPVHQSVSAGVAAYPAHAGKASALVDEADRAMYVAKREGKNRVRVAG